MATVLPNDKKRVPKSRHSRLSGSPESSVTAFQIEKNTPLADPVQNDTERDIMSNAEIITAVTVDEKTLENEEDVNAKNIVQIPKILHSERLKVVETVIQYFEQQGASVMDLLYLRRLREEAAKRRMQYGKHQNITHFYQTKKS
ncbi:hypothetical protein TNCV_3069331 [Trichonephila clavipes]|nr:hypothetical protein TNCV_3069331 [Trichonephila clavipes]